MECRRRMAVGQQAWIAALLCAILFVNSRTSAQTATEPATHLSGQVDLLRLVDLSAQRLGLNIEYDAASLKSVNVTLRIDESIGDEALWELTNQLLASRGFTSIEPAAMSGTNDPAGLDHRANVLSIVKLPDAAGLARVERDLPLRTLAGYASVLLPIRHRAAKDVAEAIKVLLSKPGGALQEMPGGQTGPAEHGRSGESSLLVSDLRPRLNQIIDLVQTLDSADEATAVTSIEARNLPAANLAALVTAAVTASNPLAARALEGKLTATADNSGLVLVAPQVEVPRWKELIEQFDRPANIESRTYPVTALGLEEVAKLIEQAARDAGPRGSGERWRIVSDSLGSVLIITATPSEHEQIAALIERLNALPPEVRRPVRAFPIRNRSVSEVVDVLTKMVEAGVLDGAEFTSAVGATATSGPSAVDPNELQRSDRPSPIVAPPTDPATTQPGAVVPRPPRTGAAERGNGDKTAAPSLTLTADEGTNTLIAVGDPRKLAQLEELLRTLDVRQPQVMIEVLVVSLNEGDTLDLGVELQKIEVHGDTIITLSSLFGLTPAADAPAGRGFTGLILNPGDFRVLIRALQTINNGRSLNMPRALVNNNQQASLDAVVQQPFVSTNASDTVATTSFGGFENAGTTITVKPQIAKGDHLVLEYAVSLSAFVGESSDPGVPPPRQQNNLQSVVTVPDGFTIVVGGIEITTTADAISQIPLLGDIPFIGEVFKSRSHSTSRSRFYVFIRPTILRQEGFEDLKYLSNVAANEADVDDGWPEVEPRIIR